MKKLALTALAALAACAPRAVPAPSPAEPPAPPPKEKTTAARKLPDLVATAERVRELKFQRPVPTLVYAGDQVQQYIDQMTAQVPKSRWDVDRRILRAFDLVGDDVKDLSQAVENLYGAQVAGFYDPERGVLVVRELDAELAKTLSTSGMKPEDALKAALLHELVHALQDQDLGLGRLVREMKPREEEGDDAAEALPMLYEGDALLAMVEFSAHAESDAAERRLDMLVPTLRPRMREATLAGLEKVPVYLREEMVARYLDGMVFVAAVHRAGGWALVDRVYGKPPETTEQVLHPEKYFAGERPALLTLPPDDALRARGFTRLAERGLGELGIRIWAGLWTTAQAGADAAAGWDGDRFALYGAKSGPDALVWTTAWDTEADAAEFEVVAEAAERTRGTAAKSEATRVFERGERADAVARNGRSVGIVRDVPADLAASLAEQAAAAQPVDVPPAPPLPGVKYAPPGASGGTGREEGHKWVDPALGFALLRPERPELRFERGPSEGHEGPIQAVSLVSPSGAARLEVTVVPRTVPLKDVVSTMAGFYASKAGEAGTPEAVKRGDGRACLAAGFKSPHGSGRVLAVAGDGRTYVLVASWLPAALDDEVKAMLEAQDSLDVIN